MARVTTTRIVWSAPHFRPSASSISGVSRREKLNGSNGNGSNGDPFHPVEELTGVAREYAAPAATDISDPKDYLSPAEAIETCEM